MDNKQTVEELLSKIEQCNKKITEINRKTAVEMGRKKEITENLERMLAQYKEVYGVELSLDDKSRIEEEYEKVVQERAEQAEKMEKVLAYIEQGKYTEVNMMLGLSMTEEDDKKAELKSNLAVQANNASGVTTRIEINQNSTETLQQENQGFTSINLSGTDNNSDINEVEYEEEYTEEKKEESVSSTKGSLTGFSFDNLLKGNNSTQSEIPESSKVDISSDTSDDSSFFTLPTNQSGTFSSFGNLVSGTRFQPK